MQINTSNISIYMIEDIIGPIPIKMWCDWCIWTRILQTGIIFQSVNNMSRSAKMEKNTPDNMPSSHLGKTEIIIWGASKLSLL